MMAKGDHVRVRRGVGAFAYWHHGIDVGRSRVIHYSGEPGSKTFAEVKRTSMASFLNGGTLSVVRRASHRESDAIVDRAESRLGERAYSLLTNNCEHFAT